MEQRSIKFRLFNKERKKMLYPPNPHLQMSITGYPMNMQTGEGGDDYIVLQYTGLKDKNGKEIYEGDITNHGIIVWIDDEELDEFVGWHLKDTHKNKYGEYDIHSFWAYTNPHEIIGNIYENPELIK